MLRPPEVDVDYGEPLSDNCRESAPGSAIFFRNYSKADIAMDCNTWTGSLAMK
jgi:hypothetical protein